MIHIGIDYSMNSPAICVIKHGFMSFYFLSSVKKYQGKFSYFHGHVYPEWTQPEERFDKISNWVLDCITEACGPEKGLNEPMKVTLEGYSMGSKGKVFHIAENTSILKHKLWQHNIPVETPAPTSIKKFATGKGNSDKARMYECFVAETGIDLENLLGGDRSNNPISDIVDSYYICKFGITGS